MQSKLRYNISNNIELELCLLFVLGTVIIGAAICMFNNLNQTPA